MDTTKSISQQLQDAVHADLGPQAKDNFVWLRSGVQLRGEPTPMAIAWVHGKFDPPGDDIGQRFYIVERHEDGWHWQLTGPEVTLQHPELLDPPGWAVKGS